MEDASGKIFLSEYGSYDRLENYRFSISEEQQFNVERKQWTFPTLGSRSVLHSLPQTQYAYHPASRNELSRLRYLLCETSRVLPRSDLDRPPREACLSEMHAALKAAVIIAIFVPLHRINRRCSVVAASVPYFFSDSLLKAMILMKKALLQKAVV